MTEAEITVITCDKCNKTVALQHPEDWDHFKRFWSINAVDDIHFCNDCRALPVRVGKLKREEILINQAVEKYL